VSKEADTCSTSAVSFPADHPALAGHFPGNPVVPGVVILEAVREAALGVYAMTNPAVPDSAQLLTVRQVKFLALLRPDQEIRIDITMDAGVVTFRCLRGTDTIAAGEMIIGCEG